jgi:hypothetical protein
LLCERFGKDLDTHFCNPFLQKVGVQVFQVFLCVNAAWLQIRRAASGRWQDAVLLLYTDGLIDSFSSYTQEQLAHAVSCARNGAAKEICEAILGNRNAPAKQTDDINLVVIKYHKQISYPFITNMDYQDFLDAAGRMLLRRPYPFDHWLPQGLVRPLLLRLLNRAPG